MKINLSYTSSLLIAVAFLGLTSCRSNDTDGNLIKGGTAMVKVNLTGTDFATSTGTSNAQASLKAIGLGDDGGVQRHGALITPSMLLEAELKPASGSEAVSRLSAQATTKIGSSAGRLNTLAAVDDPTPMGPGMMFRVIAYSQNDGSYKDHKDFTIGQPADGLTLDQGSSYKLVAYSFGGAALPAISAGELLNISSAQVAYDNTKPDFLYTNVDNYIPNNTTNTVIFKLRHKATLITTTVNSMVGNINSISNAFLSPNYTTANIPLATGSITGRTNPINQTLNFNSGIPGITTTADPVFMNADTAGNLGGTFSASINVNGTTKVVNLPNTFKITPEYKSDLNINLRTCGAYLGPNQTQWTEFMCQNLGATAGTNPFSAEAGNHGAKYQWGAQSGETGRYYSQANDQSYSGAISGWNTTAKPDGSWSDTSKTANDPCPSGYRVPTSAQWQAVIDNNPNIERVGTWADNGNYTSALYFRNSSNIRTLMLPAAGYRSFADGALHDRGLDGLCWSSSESTSNAYTLSFNSSSVGVYNFYRTDSFSVRCIKDQSASTVNGGDTTWSSSGNTNLNTSF
ncbi:FISUMP domain-containing protein [Elizabethkingia ursingii]|uniref:FISUMP domain-containing protein n=1 Tax=Elizabethkingia ursingii TaxID=1756150 RepID=UPI0009ECBAF8|nr:FISUMP domain-containing protein [Elizabethkingia ursingii]